MSKTTVLSILDAQLIKWGVSSDDGINDPQTCHAFDDKISLAFQTRSRYDFCAYDMCPSDTTLYTKLNVPRRAVQKCQDICHALIIKSKKA